MQITDILAQMGGLQSIAKELGVSETQATSAAEALAPAILGGFKKQAEQRVLAVIAAVFGILRDIRVLQHIVAQHGQFRAQLPA